MYEYIVCALLIALLIICIYTYSARKTVPYSLTQFQTTPGDITSNRSWNVASGYNNRAEAAHLMANANALMIRFMDHLRKKYHIDETDDIIAQEGVSHQRVVNAPNDIYQIVSHMLDNYNPDAFYENDPRYTKDTSFTSNKGSSMYICLRNRADPTKLVDLNTLMFTMLHESTHIANYDGWGHEIRDFWPRFKFILHEAVLAGVYKPIEYEKYPVNFCGLEIAYQPLYDKSLPQLWV